MTRQVIRAGFTAPRSERREPLACLEVHTNDLLACVTAALRGFDLAPGVSAELDPAVYQFVEDATRQHEVGDRVVLAIVLRPGDAEPDVGDRPVLDRDLDPVGEQRVDHAASMAETAASSNTEAA